MHELTRSDSCNMYASCFGESRTPSAKTSLDIETPIEPNHPGSAPMVFNRMSGEELRPAGVWPPRGTPCELSSESMSVVCVLFRRFEMTLRDARGVIMEKGVAGSTGVRT